MYRKLIKNVALWIRQHSRNHTVTAHLIIVIKSVNVMRHLK